MLFSTFLLVLLHFQFAEIINNLFKRVFEDHMRKKLAKKLKKQSERSGGVLKTNNILVHVIEEGY